jgi:hypothetical protein
MARSFHFTRSVGIFGGIALVAVSAWIVRAQQTPSPTPPADPPPAVATPNADGPVPGGPGGFGRFPGGPMMRTERKLVKQFDQDGDKRLNAAERKAARDFLKTDAANNGGRRPGFPGGRGPGGPGGFGPPGMEQNAEPPKPGRKLSPADVKPSEVSALYAPNVLRTLFLDFENNDWESELEAFHDTDVEIPATLTVDGEKLPGVGVHFRGMSSYMMVRAGHKRSLNVALDFTDKKQRLDGYKTLNLLNSHEDDSMMSTVLYSEIASHFLPVPKANFVRVVINGESWGVYVNVQQFNKDFVQENFRTEKGARWKVKGSPGGGGGLEYLGEDIAKYKERYELKTDDDEDDWKALIALCRTLNETPPDKLEDALKPILDLDGLLWFLALDCTLINGDGYWIRASDYSIYRDKAGKFHMLPHDMNETFTSPRGPGMGGPGGFMRRPRGDNGGAQPGDPNRPPIPADATAGSPPPPGAAAPTNPPPPANAPVNPSPNPNRLAQDLQRPNASANPGGGGNAPAPDRLETPGGPDRPRGFGGGGFPGGPGFGGGMPAIKGVELDPLVGLDDTRKPLRSKVLAVPALRARYLANVRTIAGEWLDWKKLGPIVAQYRALIEADVEADTRKLGTFAAFQKATADEATPAAVSTTAPSPAAAAPAPAPVPPPPAPTAAGPSPENPPALETRPPRRGPGGDGIPLRAFADQRRAYLLNYPAIQALAPEATAGAKR